MKKHVLVIDDEQGIREMLSFALSKKGYRVSTASTADEALKVVKEDAPHLVIADLQMEDTDGLVLIAEIKEIVSDVPVILLTGVIFDAEVVRENISKKVSSYLQKTAPLQQILQEVQRLLVI